MKHSLEIQGKYLIDIENQLQKMPEGTLYRITKSGKRYYFQNIFKSGSRNRIYLGSQTGKNKETISKLRRKGFLLASKKVLEGNVAALRVCLRKYEELDPVRIVKQMAASYEPEREISLQENPVDWSQAPYPRGEMHPENLKHETVGGLRVRSKSEALIAFALDIAKVPFHYEEILELQGKKIVPDFTILHPGTGEKRYWEHFGMMDDPAYAREAYKKLVLYGQNGILPGKSLIITMETENEPLGIQQIRQLIECLLL